MAHEKTRQRTDRKGAVSELDRWVEIESLKARRRRDWFLCLFFFGFAVLPIAIGIVALLTGVAPIVPPQDYETPRLGLWDYLGLFCCVAGALGALVFFCKAIWGYPALDKE